jgi:ubiquitin-protein ligase
MSKVAIKRILQRDIPSIQYHKLNDMGIYIEFNEENMLEAVAMIIGPKDSVYKDGVLFFNIKFPNNYPYSPPNVTYISRGSIRIHPNLYTGGAKDDYMGKVCLSILGTWNGPQWTTIMDISSILISIQSLLDMNPLDHEPGFTGKQSQVHINYSKCVLYEKYRTLILKNIFDIPSKYIVFEDIIINHYKQNKDEIISNLTNKINDTDLNKDLYIPIYRIHIKENYKYIKDKLLEF